MGKKSTGCLPAHADQGSNPQPGWQSNPPPCGVWHDAITNRATGPGPPFYSEGNSDTEITCSFLKELLSLTGFNLISKVF